MGIGPGRRIDLRTWVYDAATNENVFDLGRVLTENDDNRSLNADVSYISDGIRTYDHWDIEVRQLRRMISHPLEGTSLHETAGHVVTRSDGDSLNGQTFMEFIYAHRRITAQDETDGIGTEGNDALVIAVRAQAPCP